MLEQCFRLHTAQALIALKPDVLILSGNDVHSFAMQIRALVPDAKLFNNILHYAHRKGAQAERINTAPVRQFMAATRAKEQAA